MPRYDDDDDDNRDDDDETQQQQDDDNDDDANNNADGDGGDDDGQAGGDDDDQGKDDDDDNKDDNKDDDNDGQPEDIPDENADDDPVDLEGEEASNVTDEEKKEVGLMMAKELIAQLFNSHNPDRGSHMTSKHVHSEEVDHPDLTEDQTLIRLTTADAKGHATSVEAKLDTGAGDNLMSSEICEILGLPHEDFEGPEGPPTFTVGSGEEISPLALAHLHYKIAGKAYSQGFHVMETLPHDLILGGPFLLHSHLVTINIPKAKKTTDFLLFDMNPSSKKTDLSAFKAQRQAERGAAAQARELKKQVPPKALPVRKK